MEICDAPTQLGQLFGIEPLRMEGFHSTVADPEGAIPSVVPIGALHCG